MTFKGTICGCGSAKRADVRRSRALIIRPKNYANYGTSRDVHGPIQIRPSRRTRLADEENRLSIGVRSGPQIGIQGGV